MLAERLGGWLPARRIVADSPQGRGEEDGAKLQVSVAQLIFSTNTLNTS